MKSTIEFDLDILEDKMKYEICMKSSDMAHFIWELQHNFWRKWKHDETDFTLDNYKEALYELMEEYNINIDKLIV
jgi:hypothetical protein